MSVTTSTAALAELPGGRGGVDEERSAFDRLAAGHGRRLVLVGAGGLGRKTLAGLRQAGIEPLAFADNNPAAWKRTVDGLQVLSCEDAAARFGRQSAFVITVWSPGADRRIDGLRRQLCGLGVTTVVSFVPLFWKYAEIFLPHYRLDLPHRLARDADRVAGVFSLWEDEASREEYVAQLRWMTSTEFGPLPVHPTADTYFPEEIFGQRSSGETTVGSHAGRIANPSGAEADLPDGLAIRPTGKPRPILSPLPRGDAVFVDCGAFDGDTIRAFLERQGNWFREIVALEPDPENFGKLVRYVETLPADVRRKIVIRRLAAGARREQVRFVAAGSVASRIDDAGTVEVPCEPLDEILSGRSPSYVKMDIEGAEPQALAGARQTILRHHPALAVCVYHRQAHLWAIPLYLRDLWDGYRFFLRRHGDEFGDVVCYALPPSADVRHSGVATRANPRGSTAGQASSGTLSPALAGSPSPRLRVPASPHPRVPASRCPPGPLVLFGAGDLGRRTLAGLRRLGIEPECFADNQPALWGRPIDGLKVLAAKEAVRSFGRRCRFVVTVYNGSVVRRQLRELGCQRVDHFAALYRQYPPEFLPFGGISPGNPAGAVAEDARRAADVWADEPSRREYLAQLAWRSSLDTASLDPPQPVGQQHFPADLAAFGPNEVFVDGGAFVGDTLRAFLARWTGGFQAYRAFEPDPANYARLVDFVDSLDPATRRRIQVRNWALGGRSRQVAFQARGTVASAIDACGGQTAKCVTLDDLADGAGPPPSYVKLDVEGAEREVLEGGRRLLTRHPPVLSVCLYHRPADLWEIPLFLRSLGDQYRLFLRRYAEDCWELVCYAIPKRDEG